MNKKMHERGARQAGGFQHLILDAFAAIKEITRETAHLPIQETFEQVTRRRLPTVDTLYGSEDQKEGARAFAEKRAPVWRGR